MKGVSIRVRIFIAYFISMIMVMGGTFFLVRMVSAAVMKNTLSEYLMSAVDANADKIDFIQKEKVAAEKKKDSNNLFVDYKDGVLEIDDDFLQILNDVQSALYMENGSLMYGDGSLAKEMAGEPFTESRLYDKEINGKRYVVYDRAVIYEDIDGLWIRGIVPLTQQQIQLRQITGSVAAFIPIILVIIFAGSVIAASGILQPIRDMEKTASEIVDAGDLNRRIEVKAPRDELSGLAESYNDMFERLEDSFEREKQFISDASHELRTPISVIGMQAEYITEKDATREEYQSAFEVIRRQSERMRRLVEDLLDLSRLSQRGKKYPMERTEISGITSEIAKDMARPGSKGISLNIKVEPDICIIGNATLYERLLANLIDNAYKYGLEHGHIDVVLKKAADKALLIVRDDGIGMDGHTIKHSFDRFFRADEARSEGGYGLGLSLVSGIAKIHSAGIFVESSPGKGCEFKIIFPAVEF